VPGTDLLDSERRRDRRERQQRKQVAIEVVAGMQQCPPEQEPERERDEYAVGRPQASRGYGKAREGSSRCQCRGERGGPLHRFADRVWRRHSEEQRISERERADAEVVDEIR
jgi:hypothetical protein